MTDDLRHLSERFLRGDSTPAEDAALVRGVLREGFAGGDLEVPADGAYGAALDRLAARLPELQREVERADERALELARKFEEEDPASALVALRMAGDRVARRAFDELCARSQQACARDPQLALRLAEAALASADALGDADLQARAHARIAKACRVRGDFPASAEALLAAEERLGAGVGTPIARGDVALRRAALYADQSRFDEALVQSRSAGRWFARAGAATEAVRTLLQQANILRELDRLPEALSVLERAAAAVDETGEARLRLAVAVNRACYQAELGRLAEAEAGLIGARDLAARLGNPLDTPRLEWVEAILRAEQGRLGEAETLLGRVRARYLELELGHDVALATLELALVVARQGRFAEAHRLALEALPTFEALRVSPEAVAALRLALGAARETAVRVEVLRSALKRLRR